MTLLSVSSREIYLQFNLQETDPMCPFYNMLNQTFFGNWFRLAKLPGVFSISASANSPIARIIYLDPVFGMLSCVFFCIVSLIKPIINYCYW